MTTSEDATEPRDFAAVERNFAQYLPGYEPRPQQRLLAHTIEEAAAVDGHLLAQAGCGCGKSLGGVTPMLLSALRDGGRLVVATATKALQEQYSGKDLPFLEEHSGIDFTWALLKGRSNYACFQADTEVLTYEGLRRIGDLDGQVATIVDGNGDWTEAKFSDFGQQEIVELTLTRGDERRVIGTTAEHRWFVQRNANYDRAEERTTSDLRPGDKLQYKSPKNRVRGMMIPGTFGIAHGIVFGDGTRFASTDAGLHPGACTVMLYGKKKWPLAKFFNDSPQVLEEPREGYAERALRVSGLPSYLKDLPSLDVNTSYLYGWLAGYFATDGCVAKNGALSISSARLDHLEFVTRVCAHLGIDHGPIGKAMRVGKGAEETALYTLHLAKASVGVEFFLIEEHRRRWEEGQVTYKQQRTRRRWTVESVRPTGRMEKVYCAEVPTTRSFVLEGNILTGNCMAKLHSADTQQLAATEMIKAELEADPGHSGDFEHFATAIDATEQAQLSTGATECPGKQSCTFGALCFAEKAKDRARAADLVVTNTAMLMTEAQIRSMTANENSAGVQMLGEYTHLLVDEAHGLPEVAAGALGFSFTGQGISFFARDAVSWAALQSEDLSDYAVAITEAMARLDPVVMEAAGQALNLSWFVERFGPFLDVSDSVRALREAVRGVEVTRDRENQRNIQKILVTRGGNIVENLNTMLSSPDHVQVRWAEKYSTGKGQERWRMRMSPVDVSPFLKTWVWDCVQSAVLMSATLSSGVRADGGRDFSYMQRALGLVDARTVDVGSPFDLPTQARMFLPLPSAPSPKKDPNGWATYAMATTMRLVEASKGGALLLFTSRRSMEAMHLALGSWLKEQGYTTLIQGGPQSNKELARIFKEDEHSVLFAMKTFFVGVDVPGNACRLVVIDKLPFPVPTDPVFAAQSLREEQEGRFPFNSLSIPRMILDLEQGAGRLIRSKDDRGVVAILDSRLTSERYGKRILAALPNFPKTSDMAEIQAFYARSSASAQAA